MSTASTLKGVLLSVLFSLLRNGIQEVNFILINVFCYIGYLILAIQVHNPLTYVVQCCEKRKRHVMCPKRNPQENKKYCHSHVQKEQECFCSATVPLNSVFFHTSLTKCIK